MHWLYKDNQGSSGGIEELEPIIRSEIDVITPRSLDEALQLLSKEKANLRIVAGGSDVIVQIRDGVLRTSKLLNALQLNELRYITEKNGQLHIGAISTYTDIINNSLTRRHAWVLVDSAKQIGAPQLQNTATIGGNLGNASPAGDSLPPLYALGTTVVKRSTSAKHEVDIEDFFTGYRQIALNADELIEEIYFDTLSDKDRAAYVKVGLREANAISVVDVAVVLRKPQPDGSFGSVRVALGAVAPTIKRARKCEEALTRKPLKLDTMRDAAELAVLEASPISDIRGSADYRKSIVASAVYEALHEAVHERHDHR